MHGKKKKKEEEERKKEEERKRKKKEERIMPSLVATMSALASTMCVRTHYVRTNKVISNNIFIDNSGKSMLYMFQVSSNRR